VPNFYKNYLIFVEVITKTILVCFYGTQCRIDCAKMAIKDIDAFERFERIV